MVLYGAVEYTTQYLLVLEYKKFVGILLGFDLRYGLMITLTMETAAGHTVWCCQTIVLDIYSRYLPTYLLKYLPTEQQESYCVI